jgi:hypothetical protein
LVRCRLFSAGCAVASIKSCARGVVIIQVRAKSFLEALLGIYVTALCTSGSEQTLGGPMAVGARVFIPKACMIASLCYLACEYSKNPTHVLLLAATAS